MRTRFVSAFLCLLLSVSVAAQKKTDPGKDGYNWETDGLKGKVKSVRWEFLALPEYDGPNESSVRVTLYDLSGRRIRETTTSPSGNMDYEEVYTFGKTGKIIERKGTRKAGPPGLHVTWDYNDNDQLTSINYRNPDGSVDMQRTFQYDEKGKKTSSTLTSSRSPDFKEVSKFDDRERLIGEIETRGGVTVHYRRYEYDYHPNGTLQRSAVRELMREPVMGQAQIFDENGNRTEFIRYGANGEVDLREVFKLNDKGDDVEIGYFGSNGGSRGIIQTRYTYDSHGNWITQDAVHDNKPTGKKITRTITYFDEVGPSPMTGNTGTQAEGVPFITGERPILEVTEEEKGMRANWNNYRYFRLYDGGRAAFRDLKEDERDHQRRPLWRNFTISEDDYKEIKGLLESADFLNSTGEPAFWNGIDPMVFVTIQYNHPQHSKTLNIADYRPTKLKIGGYYPDSVVKLLKKIDGLRKTAQ